MEPSPTITAIRPKAMPRAPRRKAQRTAAVIVEALEAAGVEVIFALPGGTIAPVLDACLDRARIEVITHRHESGAMFAAAGYARASGKLGVVCVTSGPGMLNALTGLASAYCEGIPLLLLAGEVPRALHGRRALQEGSAHHLDVLGMARSVTKLALEITRPDAAAATMGRAIRTALGGRAGPVALTVPIDVSLSTVTAPLISANLQLDYRLDDGDMLEGVTQAARSLEQARRPVLLAGSGVRHGSGAAQLRRLAERLAAPVMTTPKAKGLFPESHPLSLGVFGHGGHPSATDYLSDGVDVLLAVGTSFSDPGTDGWSELLVPTGALIQIDVDGLQLGRNYALSQGLIGDAEAVLASLAARVAPARVARRFGVARHSDPEADATGADGSITPQRALWELQRSLPRDTIYTCDIGEHLMFATHYLHIDPPGAFMAMNGLASMGSGLCAALGVQRARPDRVVAAICGDGVFAMLGTEVATAVAAGLPVLFVVLNNEHLGMVEQGNHAIYGRTPDYATTPMRVPELAHALGAESLVIRRPGEIMTADLSSRRSALVLDVRIDRSAKLPKNGRFEELKRSTRRAG